MMKGQSGGGEKNSAKKMCVVIVHQANNIPSTLCVHYKHYGQVRKENQCLFLSRQKKQIKYINKIRQFTVVVCVGAAASELLIVPTQQGNLSPLHRATLGYQAFKLSLTLCGMHAAKILEQHVENCCCD